MNLHDPQRPKIFHKLAFKGGQYPIPRLQIWPLENGLIELSMMLPLKDDRFSGKYFTSLIEPDDIFGAISLFSYDPEKFIEAHFGTDPNGFSHAILPNTTNQSPTIKPSISIDDMLEDA